MFSIKLKNEKLVFLYVKHTLNQITNIKLHLNSKFQSYFLFFEQLRSNNLTLPLCSIVQTISYWIRWFIYLFLFLNGIIYTFNTLCERDIRAQSRLGLNRPKFPRFNHNLLPPMAKYKTFSVIGLFCGPN